MKLSKLWENTQAQKNSNSPTRAAQQAGNKQIYGDLFIFKNNATLSEIGCWLKPGI